MTLLIVILAISLIAAIVRIFVAWRANNDLRRGLMDLSDLIETAQYRSDELLALADWPHQLCLTDEQGRTVEHLVGCPRDRRGFHSERDSPPPG